MVSWLSGITEVGYGFGVVTSKYAVGEYVNYFYGDNNQYISETRGKIVDIVFRDNIFVYYIETKERNVLAKKEFQIWNQ